MKRTLILKHGPSLPPSYYPININHVPERISVSGKVYRLEAPASELETTLNYIPDYGYRGNDATTIPLAVEVNGV